MNVVASYFDGDVQTLREILDALHLIESKQVELQNIVYIDLRTRGRPEYNQDVALRPG